MKLGGTSIQNKNIKDNETGNFIITYFLMNAGGYLITLEISIQRSYSLIKVNS